VLSAVGAHATATNVHRAIYSTARGNLYKIRNLNSYYITSHSYVISDATRSGTFTIQRVGATGRRTKSTASGWPGSPSTTNARGRGSTRSSSGSDWHGTSPPSTHARLRPRSTAHVRWPATSATPRAARPDVQNARGAPCAALFEHHFQVERALFSIWPGGQYPGKVFAVFSRLKCHE